MKKNNLFFFLVAIILVSCGSQKSNLGKYPDNSVINNGKLFASFFQQKAAEYEALTQQAFNIARYRLAIAIVQIEK